MHFVDFNGVFKTPGNAKFGAYGIAGGGFYYRSISLTTPDVGYTTYCDPYWYVCYPAVVSIDQVIGDRSSWDPGIDFGGGVTFKLSTSTSFYVETRWHYMWGPSFTDGQGVEQKANGSYFPNHVRVPVLVRRAADAIGLSRGSAAARSSLPAEALCAGLFQTRHQGRLPPTGRRLNCPESPTTHGASPTRRSRRCRLASCSWGATASSRA
jgi:hypothetical protein